MSTMSLRFLALPAVCLVAGVGVGLAAAGDAAEPAPAPSEHRGLGVEAIGRVPASSIAGTTGLEGYFMQLRRISIAPGGQIARHAHAERPGLVKVIEGEWVEGTPDGERVHGPDTPGFVEDETTDHWFFNRGEATATAIVCDLTPEG